MKKWLKAAGIRALKTMAQSAIAVMSTSAIIEDVNWRMVISSAILAAVLSICTSIVGLPELEKEDIDNGKDD